jgi:YbbR domain-containing protein
MSLSKDYTVTMSFPVQYINLRSNEILANNFSETIDIEVKTKGFRLLLDKFKSHHDTVLIDIKYANPLWVKNHYYLLTNSRVDKITSQLGNTFKIIKINPDTIFLDFNKKITKRVPVKTKLVLNFDSQYQLADSVLLNPAFINISGATDIISKINFVETVPINLKKINRSMSVKAAILKTADLKMIDINPTSVQAKIKVTKYTEGTVELPIEIANLPSGYSLKTFPDKISVKYNVAFEKFGSINPMQFKAVVDYKKIESGSNKLKILLIKHPAGITNLKLSTEKVEYIIRK